MQQNENIFMEIEKNVPMRTIQKRGRPPKYPFSQMEIGDSIVVPGKSSLTNECKAYNAAQQCARRMGWKFSARQEVPGETVRIWRVE